MEPLDTASLSVSLRSAEPYANYMRKRTSKQRRKKATLISKQLQQCKDLEAAFRARRAEAIASAEAPSLVVQQY